MHSEWQSAFFKNRQSDGRIGDAIKFDICKILKNFARPCDGMRMMIWIVGLMALVTSLNSSLYGGLYTRGTVRMFSEMAADFGF